jgi:hypothetical protein
MGVRWERILSAASLVAAAGCGGDTLEPHEEQPDEEEPREEEPREEIPACPAGTEGCACYGNGSCDGSLQCGPSGTCSKEDVSPPPAYKAGVRMRVFGSGACSVPQGVEAGIGEPPPDSAAVTGKGAPLFDGEKGVNTTCRVSGGSDFTVVATASQSPIAFRVDGQIASTGTGLGTISVYVPEANGELSSPTSMPCMLTAVHTSAGYQIEPGAVWAKFTCGQVTQPPAYSCQAEGEFVFENCD